MTRLLRFDLDELDAYVTRIAAATGIPAAHIEKDYWVTEVLRGISAASRETSCSIVLQGGTSLSKAHHLIQRFSEDVDLIAVLPAGGTESKDTALKTFVAAAAEATGLESETDPSATTRGVKRSAVLAYPTTHGAGGLRPLVLVEVGTRGGALARAPRTVLVVRRTRQAGCIGGMQQSTSGGRVQRWRHQPADRSRRRSVRPGAAPPRAPGDVLRRRSAPGGGSPPRLPLEPPPSHRVPGRSVRR